MVNLTDELAAAAVSDLPAESELAELVALYLGQLKTCADSLDEAVDAQDLTTLTRMAHRLSRASFYGFGGIATKARWLEAMARSGGDSEAIDAQARILAEICRQARTSHA